MHHIDFNNPCHVYFIGIGGISMSGLADILFDKGFKVSGSDSKQSPLTDKLALQGINVHISHNPENITRDIDLVVHTAAIHKDNPEYIAAVKLNIPIITRAVLLGEIMSNYKVAIGVSGTHGKTTTTSMLASILIDAGFDPTVSVGGILTSINGNLRIGRSDNFITEACEYTNSFLSFYPTIGIILNIEEDHMDFFKDINDIRNSFQKYASLLPDDGLLVISDSIDCPEEICSSVSCPVVTVGCSPDSDYHYDNVTYHDNGCCSYTLISHGSNLGTITLSVPGIHNICNSLAAIAAALHLNADMESIRTSLRNFTGTRRRFEKKGIVNGFTVIDDYAHHPSEIRATLNAASDYPHNRLIVVFQPHTYTRTKAFLKDFAAALSSADLVILADIYAARETDTLGISSLNIKELIDDTETECIYEPDFETIRKLIMEKASLNDLVITMGAGNITDIAEALIK